MMIRLTNVYLEKGVFLSAQAIEAVNGRHKDGGSNVWLSCGETFEVREEPEEVLALARYARDQS